MPLVRADWSLGRSKILTFVSQSIVFAFTIDLCFFFSGLAVSCGERAQLFCFKCGDFVSHPLFDQERERLELSEKIPLMSWKAHRIYRSFDAFQFLDTQDHGIVWRGLIATYPVLVPKEHILAAQLSIRRQAMFEGRVHESWIATRPVALEFCANQSLLGE
jgi:ubiquitin carboxyl-terminal hydrolase 22/27/51